MRMIPQRSNASNGGSKHMKQVIAGQQSLWLQVLFEHLKCFDKREQSFKHFWTPGKRWFRDWGNVVACLVTLVLHIFQGVLEKQVLLFSTH